MRLLLAARLSQTRDGQTGLDSQDADARAGAERAGHEVIDAAADHISGRTSPFDRPNLGPWLSDPIRMARYDGLIVSKLDRLSRGRDWNIRRWAEERGKKILVVSPELCWPPEPGDTSTPIVWDVLVNISSAEWENTSARYRRMQAHLRTAGAFVGRPPFGYRIVGEAKAKALVPDEGQADAIRAVVALYLGGRSLRDLCSWLDSAGVPTRRSGAWSPKTLSDVFRNEVLAGRRTDSAGRTVLRVPPILDTTTWRMLQVEMDRRASRKGVARQGTPMLGGVAVCGRCGGTMTRINSGNTHVDGTKIDIFYYRCAGTTTSPSRCVNMFPLGELEARTDRYVRRTLGRWRRYETAIIPGHGHQDEIDQVERDIRDLDLDADDYGERAAALVTERKRMKGLPSVPDEVIRRPTGDTIGQHWATLTTDADRRAFLQRLGMTVRVQSAKSRRAHGADADAGDLVGFELGEGFSGPEFIGDGLDRELTDDEHGVPGLPA